MHYFWKDLHVMVWRLDIITRGFWLPYRYGNEPNMDRGVLGSTESRFRSLVSRLSAQFLPIAATFSGACSRNKKHENNNKKRQRSAAFLYLGVGKSKQSDGAPRQMPALKPGCKTQRRRSRKHAAPVYQRVRRRRLRLVFTFNRTFPCTSDENSS